ncbi:hypothetical protein P154DRAFT_596475 [Amniculicola lignicola CBS 123094]|uniref:Uncharacterized protein n=1 Tax=Amniculicola lignicola CBS 123094 TaxID=1392246 RepID=A0A6A5WI52_9PLEO|nr:hypothetical protein P154DRAFT_596475 [Amniculicola lignicola CBS 123094]
MATTKMPTVYQSSSTFKQKLGKLLSPLKRFKYKPINNTTNFNPTEHGVPRVIGSTASDSSTTHPPTQSQVYSSTTSAPIPFGTMRTPSGERVTGSIPADSDEGRSYGTIASRNRTEPPKKSCTLYGPLKYPTMMEVYDENHTHHDNDDTHLPAPNSAYGISESTPEHSAAGAGIGRDQSETRESWLGPVSQKLGLRESRVGLIQEFLRQEVERERQEREERQEKEEERERGGEREEIDMVERERAERELRDREIMERASQSVVRRRRMVAS